MCAEVARPSTIENKIHRLIHQISIEPPLHLNNECVYINKVFLPETPPRGARIKVIAAGVCFRRSRSISNISFDELPSNISSFGIRNNSFIANTKIVSAVELQSSSKTKSGIDPSTLHIPGVKDSALFAGFEVAGIVDKLGREVDINRNNIRVGDHVIVYPYDEAPASYSEYMAVPELIYLIHIPYGISFNTAATLPTGGLLGMTACRSAFGIINGLAENAAPDTQYKILIVGTGGLALWAYRLIEYYSKKSKFKDDITICIACLNSEGISIAQEIEHSKFVQWEEFLEPHNKSYEEKEIVQRTRDVCGGPVDVVINFGTISRTLLRSLRCTRPGGTVLISDEFTSVLLPKFIELGRKNNIEIYPVSVGSIDLLRELAKLVAAKEITPPPFKVFEINEIRQVVNMLCQSQITGRAVLTFQGNL